VDLVIAEKPSVARDLARVLGVRGGGEWLENDQFAITWCVGHLVELDEPASYNEAWKAWRLDRLPMLPEEFRLRPSKHARDQLKTVTKLLKDKRFTGVINACDAGREGELIFRYVYQYAKSKLPVRRLWISSLTDDAIKRGFAGLRPGADYDALAAAAYSRSEADWLVGMNATRAVTTRSRTGYQKDGTLFSIGRVQTPTLGLLVRREDEIQAFVPRSYWEVRGDFKTEKGVAFQAGWRVGKLTRLSTEGLAEAVVSRDRGHYALTDPAGPRVVGLTAKTVREPAPQLFDLTTLQRTANRRFGFSAARTLEIAQALYERHKVVTYPRTDSRHLSSDVAKGLPQLFEQLTAIDMYAPFAKKLVATPPRLTARIVDDTKVSDHHAIIPTGAYPRSLDRDEARLFDLIARRFLGAFYPDAEIAVTEAWIRVGGGDDPPPPLERADRDTFVEALPPPPDHYLARGRVRMVAGWQEVAGIDGDKAPKRESRDGRDDDRDEDATGALPPLVVGQRLAGAFSSIGKQTTPPSRHTEATLLAAMESAGKHIEDEALRAAMKDVGLGTPATRASIIETLLRRRYVDRDKQHLVPTPTGIGLIRALVAVKVASLASAELTGSWEARLARVARGEEARAAFMADIERYVVETIDAIRGSGSGAMPTPMPVPPAPTTPQTGSGGKGRSGGARASDARSTAAAKAPKAPKKERAKTAKAATCPQCQQGTVIQGNRGWGCSRWREGCRFVSASPPPVPDKAPKKPRAPKEKKPAVVACPQCAQGTVIQGNRGWGCSRWREGCHYTSTTAPVPAKAPKKPRDPSAVAVKGEKAPKAPKKSPDSSSAKAITCPACEEGTVVAGNRGWGCSRWREGCRFVLWYERASKDLSPSQLQAAIASQPG